MTLGCGTGFFSVILTPETNRKERQKQELKTKTLLTIGIAPLKSRDWLTTERRDQMVSTHASYSVGPVFESMSRHGECRKKSTVATFISSSIHNLHRTPII